MVKDYKLPGYRGALNDRCVTIAEALKPAGYFTAVAGKWHVGGGDGQRPTSRGFDRFYGSTRGGIMYDLHTLDLKRDLYEGDTLLASGDEKLPEGFYSTHTFTDKAIGYIDEAKEAGKPFFLYLAHIAPHFPLQAPKETIAKYRGKYSSASATNGRSRSASSMRACPSRRCPSGSSPGPTTPTPSATGWTSSWRSTPR